MPDAGLQSLNGAVQEMNFARKQSAFAILAAFAFAVPVQAADFDLCDGKTVASIVTDGTQNTANLLAHYVTSLSAKRSNPYDKDYQPKALREAIASAFRAAPNRA
jgi:GH35 family endo-1,4-beta-xylanase